MSLFGYFLHIPLINKHQVFHQAVNNNFQPYFVLMSFLMDLNAYVALILLQQHKATLFQLFLSFPVSILIQIQITGNVGLFSILKHDAEHDWILFVKQEQ